MAVILYPKNSLILRRDTITASYEQVLLSTYPNSIIYFGSGSELSQITASSLSITSSWSENSISASYAPGGSGTTLGTGSTYPITSSWAISASYAPDTGTALGTGSSYPITSSWATNVVNDNNTWLSTGSSYPITSSWAINWNSSSVVSLINTKQNNIATGSTMPFTSSWATNVVNDNDTWLSTGSSYPITSSWAMSASYAPDTSKWLATGSSYPITSSWATNVVNDNNTWLSTGSSYPITSSWAVDARTASLAPNYQLLLATGSAVPFTSSWATNVVNDRSVNTGSTYPITSSWSVSSSWSPDTSKWLATGSSYPITSSWAVNWNSASVVSLINTKQNNLATGSVVPFTSSWATNVVNDNNTWLATGSTYPITSSWAISASYAPGIGGGTTLGTGSSYPITSSWAESASYALNGAYLTPVVLSDGATINTDTSLGNYFRVTLGGNRTLGNPTNGKDGERIIWEIIQDATGNRTLTLDTDFVLGRDLTSVTLSTESLARDYLTSVYNTSRDQWDVVALIRGYGAPTGSGNLIDSASYAVTSSYSFTSSLYILRKIQVVSSSFADPFVTDASLGDHFRSIVSSNFLLQNPSNAYDGQRITWELIQDDTGGHTASYDTKFAFGADVPATDAILNQTASKRDFIVSIYNQTEDKHYVVGFNTGF